jgi:hypothetical protein
MNTLAPVLVAALLLVLLARRLMRAFSGPRGTSWIARFRG